ncbi:MAG: FtsX-like permease family protein [Oscillibacter sp.]
MLPQVFFYIHIRRREFAIARSLGTKRIETVIMVFVEICLMFLVGAAIGTILILVVQETAIQYAMAAALFFCYECRGNYSLLDGNWKKRNPITTGG